MIFASAIFLYAFLPLFLAVYYLSPRGWRSFIIALASYLFYGWWRPDFVILMWVSTLLDFHCGRRITEARSGGGRGKPWVVLSICANLGLLGYFKYANFGIDTLNTLLADMGAEPFSWTTVILPVGISFYTFQTMSYTIDVYRGTSPAVRSFRDFMCYVALFPQLVAGPIVRYNTVAEQLKTRTHTFGKFYQGVLAFQSGLAKKVLIADILGPVADEAFRAVELAGASGLTDAASVVGAASITSADAWVGTLAYTFQIYFDFSGYSDMAIGLGLMMGFRFPINFDQPYRALSITDFWRRWHVSLSTFLRDYLYVPLGGNRKGVLRTYTNLALTMLLGGLWHGAAWTFIAWGAYQGIWLVIERLAGKRSLYAAAPRVLQIAATFVLAMFGWVLFRADSMQAAGTFFGAMFGGGATGGLSLQVGSLQLLVGVAAALLVWGMPTTQALVHRARARWTLPLQAAFLLALIHLHYEDHVPFLYFQF
jgi:alginate O-acetyltransferase complex protein AlgI